VLTDDEMSNPTMAILARRPPGRPRESEPAMKRTFRLSFVAGIAIGFAAPILLVVATAVHGATPQQAKRAPIRPINSIAGKDLYRAYCEQCHGSGGKGDGPAAAGLKKPPADLTQLAARNNGKFNRTAVEAFISGQRPGGVLGMDGTGSPAIINADGTLDEMPVYGILFRYLWQDQPSSIRCGILARYIESIQAK
jgi:mono/diheme cytochrome c family protein